MTGASSKTGAPLVSIVIPTHNAWDWTSRALAAVHDHTDRPYEVIVCDNASSDETPMRLTELGNARVVLNAENLGFGTACNQGAALARAPFLVFLNSDAIVQEDWLRPLLEHLRSTPSVGAVGPLLVNTDGSIQAAGSTVLGDALTISHGDEPSDFRFPRVVDYVAGACLATRRASFHRLGGFDAVYGLAYYEDVDLCFRLQSAGYHVVFEPGSVVTHAVGASSGNDLKDELITRNRQVFGARWGHEFAGRPSYAESRTLPAAFLRDVSADARLLMLPGPQMESCGDLADTLARRFPNIRVTVLGNRPAERRGAVEWISAASPAAALGDRRFYYDAVVMVDLDASGPLTAALDESQPQAVRIEAGEDEHALFATLGQTGVAC
jgi:GT2 family glycosyltransferase